MSSSLFFALYNIQSKSAHFDEVSTLLYLVSISLFRRLLISHLRTLHRCSEVLKLMKIDCCYHRLKTCDRLK